MEFLYFATSSLLIMGIQFFGSATPFPDANSFFTESDAAEDLDLVMARFDNELIFGPDAEGFPSNV